MRKINGPCIASDGTVYSFSDVPCTNKSTFTSKGDKEWRSWRNATGSKRKKNEGWLMYHKRKDISYLLNRKVTLKILLSFK